MNRANSHLKQAVKSLRIRFRKPMRTCLPQEFHPGWMAYFDQVADRLDIRRPETLVG